MNFQFGLNSGPKQVRTKFRVQNVSEYISNVQWVPNWIEKYFFTKFLDQLVFLIFTFLLVLVFFKKIKFNNKISHRKKPIIFF